MNHQIRNYVIVQKQSRELGDEKHLQLALSINQAQTTPTM